ncbi:MAG: hypothetical protein [Olavius algarvensis spirochete endosymbiont]|nr:MAG: hypothetical protein [Olavius algarvensis spirochete endosymbiont]
MYEHSPGETYRMSRYTVEEALANAPGLLYPRRIESGYSS